MRQQKIALQLAIAVGFGFAVPAFAHTGSLQDPLPSAVAAKGHPPVPGCPAGMHGLWHRTTQANNDPKHLAPACFAAADAEAVKKLNYKTEKPGAAHHAGSQQDPLPSAAAAKGKPPVPECPKGFVGMYHRTTMANNDPKHLAPACFPEAEVPQLHAALYKGEHPAPGKPPVEAKGPVPAHKGHAGSLQDPMPSSVAAKGHAPLPECPAGMHALWHRTTQANNDPKFLRPACFPAAEVPALQKANYRNEKPGAAHHAGTEKDPLPSSVAAKGHAPHPGCPKGWVGFYHRTTAANNDPKFLKPACFPEAEAPALHAALYKSEMPK